MKVIKVKRTSVTDVQPNNELNSTIKFEYSSENQPNADILLPSLRQSGYTLETAIGDLVDNPLDKNADTIVVSLDNESDIWKVSVADNGLGMDSDTLDQMMRLGSRTNHDLVTDLGAFGLGSTTASLSLGRQQHVLTRDSDEKLLSAATDLDKIVKAKKFIKHLGEAQSSEEELFNQAFLRWDLEVPKTGTLVTISKCDNIGRVRLRPAIDSVKKYIGQTYRYFIMAGKRFYVNGELVEEIDPLERYNSGTTILLEENIEYSYPSNHVKYGQKEKIGLILVQLQDYGQEANSKRGYNMSNQGFYVMRNRREIVPHTTFGIFNRHNSTNRFRGEILFPASMDVDLGVSFLKSAWDIKPSQSLEQKLQQVTMPYINQAKKNYKKSNPVSDQEVTHEEATKVIKQRSPFLRKPLTKIEKRNGSQKENNSNNNKQEGEESRNPRHPKIQKALADIASFEVRELGTTAPFYEANLEGKKVIITYNSLHPFYERFLLENKDNPSIITAIDYLVYSMATAEIMSSDESTFRFLERLREDTSFNLRQLLTT